MLYLYTPQPTAPVLLEYIQEVGDAWPSGGLCPPTPAPPGALAGAWPPFAMGPPEKAHSPAAMHQRTQPAPRHAIRPSHPPAVLVTYIPEHQSSTHAAQAQAPHTAQRAAAPEGGQSSAPATPAPSHQGPLHDAGNPQPSKSLYIYTASHRRKATRHQPPATSQVEPPASQPATSQPPLPEARAQARSADDAVSAGTHLYQISVALPCFHMGC